MLDIKFIRENPDLIKEAARKKHLSFDVAALLAADDKRLATLSAFETARAEQNKQGEAMATATDKEALRETLKTLKEDVQKKEDALREAMKEWQALMLQVPNVPDVSVPEGADENENVRVRTSGEKPSFSFTPLDHVA
ncbi:MAG TPA: serine--tRNA ligase, partial [Candidatus Paceibacterota bacterium]|nr:serine--tRNA ligase [Candidatus Paceibacterota bacterium]